MWVLGSVKLYLLRHDLYTTTWKILNNTTFTTRVDIRKSEVSST